MRRWLSVLPLVALALAGILGSAMGVIDLQKAVARSQDLYRLDTVGSQIESDLEFQTQESRRAFLYALALTDPIQQLSYMDSARAADHSIRDTIGRLRQLHAPEEIERSIQDFERSWNRYAQTRDAVVASILIGDSREALDVDQRKGTETFAAALQNLHALKRAVELHAQSQSARVDLTLKRCMLGLACFVLAMFSIVFVLLRVNRAWTVARCATLGSANQALERARKWTSGDSRFWSGWGTTHPWRRP